MHQDVGKGSSNVSQFSCWFYRADTCNILTEAPCGSMHDTGSIHCPCRWLAPSLQRACATSRHVLVTLNLLPPFPISCFMHQAHSWHGNAQGGLAVFCMIFRSMLQTVVGLHICFWRHQLKPKCRQLLFFSLRSASIVCFKSYRNVTFMWLGRSLLSFIA